MREALGADDDLPDLIHDSFQEVEVALFGDENALPVPLIDVGGVVMVEEIIFADGAHVGADAFADTAVELFQGNAFPLGGRLHDLGIDGMQVAVIGNVELDGGAGAVAVEHVVDAAFDVDDERDFHHHQVEFLT